jgi:hypothetical protein
MDPLVKPEDDGVCRAENRKVKMDPLVKPEDDGVCRAKYSAELCSYGYDFNRIF